MSETQKSPFQPFDELGFSDYQCFLCGSPLDENNKTDEHVFPEWLLRKFDLWDRRVTLLNRTTIPYRNLKIPCCFRCNTQYLSNLENGIRNAVEQGPSSVANIPKLQVYQWMGKIFFGLLYRELSLELDRSNPSLGYITTPKFLQDYRALHGFIQSIFKPIEFEGFFPGSIFIFQVDRNTEFGEFDYSDSFNGMAFCIRMSEVGIIACLKDDGQIQDSLSELYDALKNVTLHPMQFDEFCAIVFYNAYSMIRNLHYASLTTKENKSTIIQVPGMSLAPMFEDWDYEIFAYFLEEFWSKYGFTHDQIYVPPNTIMTTLGDYM